MALHDWDPVLGLPLWDEFSRRCPERYDEAACREKWQTFSRGGGLTIGTVFKEAKDRGWTPPWEANCRASGRYTAEQAELVNAMRPEGAPLVREGDPFPTNDHNPWPVGTWIHASDQDNYGQVEEDRGGDKVKIGFLSPSGHAASVWLPRSILTPTAAKPTVAPAADVDYTQMADEDLGLFNGAAIKVRSVTWLWRHRLAFGSAAMVAAEGGTGKTLVGLYVAAQITVGGPWADGSGNAPLGDVIILSAEDKAEDTLKPRLMALGADLTRVRFLKARVTIKEPGKEPQIHPVSFQDLDYWQEIMRRVPDCRMLLVDPLPAYLGRGVNDHRNNEVRAVMEPFIQTVIEPRDSVDPGLESERGVRG